MTCKDIEYIPEQVLVSLLLKNEKCCLLREYAHKAVQYNHRDRQMTSAYQLDSCMRILLSQVESLAPCNSFGMKCLENRTQMLCALLSVNLNFGTIRKDYQNIVMLF